MENQNPHFSEVLKLSPTTSGINSFHDVFNSKSPCFQNLKGNERHRVENNILVAVTNFLSINSTGEDHGLTAIQFTEDIMFSRPDWKVEDIILFFKFIRRRQDLPECKIFGNKITALKLMELAVAYENEKSAEREKAVKQYNEDPYTSTCTPDVIKENIKKIYDKCKPYHEDKALPTLTQDDIANQYKAAELDVKKQDQVINNMLLSFDRLYIKKGRIKQGQRAIEIDGEILTLDEFLTKNY